MSSPSDHTIAGRFGSEVTVPGDEAPVSASSSTLRIGDRVGRYVVVGRLGAGGMGEVFAAYDPELDRKVALKLLHAESRSKPSGTARHRMLREAQAMARLTHPNTVTVHDVGEHDGRVFLAMEMIAGQTLRVWSQTPRPWRDVIAVFAAAGRGLAAAHAVDLIHRDFKPDNVMLANDGRVLVMDFGLARATEVSASNDRDGDADDTTSPAETSTGSQLAMSLTRTGALMGTPAYMAPEQFMGRPVDARTDQFSFCIALYEALCGERPFDGNTVPILAASVSAGRVRPFPPARILPPWLRRIVLRGLAPVADQRWPDMHALVEALQADPSRKKKKLGLAALGVAGLAAASWFGWQAATMTPRVCSDSAAQLEQVWNEARRAEVREKMRETGLPYAEQTADEVDTLLTRWSAAWIDGHRETCEASEIHKSQSAEVKDQRMRCLDRHRRQLATLVDDLAQGEPATLEQAVARAEALPNVESCGDLEQVARQVAPPDDPEIAARVEALRAELGDLELTDEQSPGTMRLTARLQELDALHARAEGLGYGPLAAEIDLQRGLHALRLGSGDGGEQALRRAYFQARRHGADAMAIDAALALIEAVGIVQGRYRNGLDWADHAAVEIVRSGTALHEARRLRRVAYIHIATSAFDAADDSLLEAIAIYRRELSADALVLAQARRERIATLVSRGRLEEAEREVAEIEPVVRRRLGPDHPQMGSFEHLRVHFAGAHGRHDEARDRALALIAFYERLGLAHDPRVATELQNLGTIYINLEDYDSARSVWNRALDLRKAIFGPEHPDVADLIVNLTSLDGPEEAEASLVEYERAIAMYEAAGAAQSHKAAASRLNIGNVLFELGRGEESLPHFARAGEMFTASMGRTASDAIKCRFYRAYVLRTLERLDEAVAALREEVELLRNHPDPDHWLANGVALLIAIEMDRGRPEAVADLVPVAEAIDLDPLRVEARFNLRFTLLRLHHALGHETKAREGMAQLERELAAHPDAFPPQATTELATWHRENP